MQMSWLRQLMRTTLRQMMMARDDHPALADHDQWSECLVLGWRQLPPLLEWFAVVLARLEAVVVVVVAVVQPVLVQQELVAVAVEQQERPVVVVVVVEQLLVVHWICDF